jgi:altronate dehydratase
MADFKNFISGFDPERVKFMVLQEVEDEFSAGLKIIEGLVNYASRFRQEPIPVSELKIGLKCGGSDGFSGITANPLVGSVSDKLIRYGGTSIFRPYYPRSPAKQSWQRMKSTVTQALKRLASKHNGYPLFRKERARVSWFCQLLKWFYDLLNIIKLYLPNLSCEC